jgi:hypothetical protein
LDDGFDLVQGWCNRTALEISGGLIGHIQSLGIRRGACEIGVFHGKFLIGLANTVHEYGSPAIDIFNHQWLNVDGSGGGSQEIRPAIVSGKESR